MARVFETVDKQKGFAGLDTSLAGLDPSLAGLDPSLASLDTSLAGLDPSLSKRPYACLIDQPLIICDGIKQNTINNLQVVGITVNNVFAVSVTRPNYYASPLCNHTGDRIPYKDMSHRLRVLYADEHFSSTIHNAAIYVWQTGNHQVEILFVYKDDKDTKVGSISKPLNELNCGQIDCKCRDNCKKT